MLEEGSRPFYPPAFITLQPSNPPWHLLMSAIARLSPLFLIAKDAQARSEWVNMGLIQPFIS